MIWISDVVYTLPALRLAGIYAPANGQFSTHVFTVPSSGPMWINAVALWKGQLVTGNAAVEMHCIRLFLCI